MDLDRHTLPKVNPMPNTRLLATAALIAAAPLMAATVVKPAAKPVAAATQETATETAGPGSDAPAAKAINAQGFVAGKDKAATRRMLIRAQVLLDRAHFSPGVIDGKTGGNLELAVSGYQEAKGMPVTGKLDKATFASLVAADSAPVIRDYTTVDADVAGPFADPVEPGDYVTMAARPSMTWTSPLEAIAERAHMDEALVMSLNTAKDITKSGTTLLVANVGRPKLAPVTRIEVDKAKQELRAYAADKVVAIYPATVGSTERPAPSGDWQVRTVATAATYTFDPSRLTFHAKGGTDDKPVGKLTIKAGPNNPVGTTWIDLTKDTYGIHGSPDPRLVGKRASHGCVRLTNWDAQELAKAVKAGAKVSFVGVETRAS